MPQVGVFFVASVVAGVNVHDGPHSGTERPAAVMASDPGGGPGLGAGGDLLSAWVERTGPRPAERDRAGLRFAFYGRVSTEDWQDPVT